MIMQVPFLISRKLLTHRELIRKLYLTRFVQNKEICLSDPKLQTYLDNLRTEYYNLRSGVVSDENRLKRINDLSSIVNALEQRNCILSNISSLKEIDNEKDEEMKDLIKEEKEVYSNMLNSAEENLMEQLLALCEDEECTSIFFEVSAGVGGQEAMLFAKELIEMYSNFLDYKGFDYEVIHTDYSDLGGVRHATFVVYGTEANKILKHEAGVHRVQRIPITEKSGRMHTSTASVAVVPRYDDAEVMLNEKDLKIETKRASGAGGQHVNTTDSAVRIVHLPTGLTIECQTERSQNKNKEIALRKLQALLLKMKIEAQESDMVATKKKQVGSSNRNEKIRTYNFLQDRITDHRIGSTVHNLETFLEGGEMLDHLIKKLIMEHRKANLLKLLEENKN